MIQTPSHLRCEGCHLLIQPRPLLHDPARALQLGLLRQRIVAQVDGLCELLGRVAAPGLAPQPLLQGMGPPQFTPWKDPPHFTGMQSGQSNSRHGCCQRLDCHCLHKVRPFHQGSAAKSPKAVAIAPCCRFHQLGFPRGQAHDMCRQDHSCSNMLRRLVPHLRQGEDGHLVLGIVGQILVQVGQAGRVSAELVVHHPQLIARSHLPASKHHHNHNPMPRPCT